MRITRLGEPGREHLLQRFLPQPDLVEYRRLRVGLGPEDGLLHAWVGEFAENPKDNRPQILWRIVVFDRHEAGTVKPAELLLPAEAAAASWTDGQGRPIPPPRSCIQSP